MFDKHYLYLTINFFSFIFPFLLSFHKKSAFYKSWKYLAWAIILPGILFVLWDEYFTQLKIWGFNPEYVTGIYIGNMPVEEILFFICIPYACVFSYFIILYLIPKDYFASCQRYISLAIIMLMSGIALFTLERLYTSVTFIALAVYLAFLEFILKAKFLGRFYFSYLFMLVPFFLVNGILTGSFIEGEVVWYDNTHNLGIRLGTIPAEDVFYGMLLLMMNVSVFEWLRKPAKQILPS